MNLNCFALNKNHLVVGTGNKVDDFNVTGWLKSFESKNERMCIF